jgi:hypothetical protein
MGHLSLVDTSSYEEHDSNNDHCDNEDAQVIGSLNLSVCKTKLKVGPPMEGIENVEQSEHAYNLEPVFKVIFVDGFIISFIYGEVSTVFLGLSELILLHSMKQIDPI